MLVSRYAPTENEQVNMARRKTEQEQLEALEKKKSQLDARIQKKRSAVRASQRKKDTRRKIIAGALALEHSAIDSDFGSKLTRLLNEHVTRPEDRKLFELD